MKRLGLNRPLNDELIETLEEIETERNNLLLGEDIYNQPATKTKLKASSHQSITRTPLTYKIGHSKKLAFTNRFYLRKFLNSIGLLAKKEKNHNNVT